jgi:acyl-CoA thioesterase-2
MSDQAPSTVQQVIDCLTTVAPDEARPGTWRAGTLGLPHGAVFGGELLGQTVAIAAAINPDMTVKSIAAAFPRGVRDTGSLEFSVTSLHEGNAYATHRIDIEQPNRAGDVATAFTAQVMCHRPAPGLDHNAPMPIRAGSPHDARPVDMGLIPWDCRFAGTTDLNDRAAQPNELFMWTRVPETLPSDLVVHQALLAFVSDLTLIGTAILPHEGWSQLDAHVTLRTSVIAHQIQFHRPFRIDEWLLIAQTSPVAANGSAYGQARVFTQAGEIVATFTQESMTRTDNAGKP